VIGLEDASVSDLTSVTLVAISHPYVIIHFHKQSLWLQNTSLFMIVEEMLLFMLSCRWGMTTSLNCSLLRALCSSPRWCMHMEKYDGMLLTGENTWTPRKSCPCATLPTTNPTSTDPVTNPPPPEERPTNNRLREKMLIMKPWVTIYFCVRNATTDI
jgi:hypothetical protein